jgi:hypothetical protein
MIGATIVAFLCGAGLAVWVLKKRIRADERERMRADEYFFSNLWSEREVWQESRRRIFKEKWLVIRERLMYKQYPLIGWMQSERKIDETLDTAVIKDLAGSLSQLISEAQSPFSIKTTVHSLPQREEGAASSPGKAGPI